MKKNITFFDTEIGVDDKEIKDLGAIRDDGAIFHNPSVEKFWEFVADCDFLCGHNVIRHDLKYLKPVKSEKLSHKIIDTLFLSPLLFPKKPYHHLLKDDKLQVDELNNPVNDSIKARILFEDEVNAFKELPNNLKMIYCGLLYQYPEFKGFFDFVNFKPYLYNLPKLISVEFNGLICANANLNSLINHYPIELAYGLALIKSGDYSSITPRWLLYNFPKIQNVIKFLRNTPCAEKCEYCNDALNIHKWLQKIYPGFEFRKFANDDFSIQEKAVQAAVDGKSLLAVFPTGGGKSLVFQLPALIAGQATHGLTVVISPLQSLMKDQVDSLTKKGIEGAVTINGLLDSIERANAIEQVGNGKATLLYISPEQLRSRTIINLLMSRNIARFVIDEAHCLSAWGQDFRVDYLYIGDFIRILQDAKNSQRMPIPVSCFTATAKLQVISDIVNYFKEKLDLDIEQIVSNAVRENLHYIVLQKDTEEEKYHTLRELIKQKQCPTIVYVSRTKTTIKLANNLTADGFPALPYNGKMEANDKKTNQDAFMNDEVSVMVATSAFGMGVDKNNVELIIHYDISDSLENYIQEAGRAARDVNLNADCYVLFDISDLDKHFILLNQSKVSFKEIQQIWQAIKSLTQKSGYIYSSALEIARQAGWDTVAGSELETRVRTSLNALESREYIARGHNVPRIYATSIRAKNMAEAAAKIDSSPLFTDQQKINAKRIIKSLISSRSIAKVDDDRGESRTDYLAEILGLKKEDVIDAINLMRQEGILDDDNDMAAYINDTDNKHRSSLVLERFSKLERFILSLLKDGKSSFSFKELNEGALAENINSASVKNIRTILHFLYIKSYIYKEENRKNVSLEIVPTIGYEKLMENFEKRIDICQFIIDELYLRGEQQAVKSEDAAGDKLVLFSLVGLYEKYMNAPRINLVESPIVLKDVEDALFYLSKIGALKLEGGFLVLYNAMQIKRLKLDNRIKFKIEDYKKLDDFYKQRIHQIHIVGEYAKLMMVDYEAAKNFVADYFNMDYKKFIAKYFKGERAQDIERNITPERYNRLFGELSDIQREIINDTSQYIVVAAGPGSGKTKVLVHKLASLYQLEDVKHEQMLMLTFSRAAATEFKKRLVELIGTAAYFVEIKTFHSYCFDLLNKIGTIEASSDIVKTAAEMIHSGEIEMEKITKTVLVIDEAQDMDEDEFGLVQALMSVNDEMRVIAVGDDDQNIFEFRGSDSKYLRSLITDYGARKYEMRENYRSKVKIVSFANAFLETINNRLKNLPIQSVYNDYGEVTITHHASANMEEAVVSNILSSQCNGRIGVLTNTNEEALNIMGLLLRNDRRAKLIQSTDGFKLINLVEIPFFLNEIKKAIKTSVISDKVWNQAKELLYKTYYNSKCIENVTKLIENFEATNMVKYMTDLEEYINESNIEDFYADIDNEIIYVSTIHKAKGREFDIVYMMLKDSYGANDEERRKIYVGMTRAKNELQIHTNTGLFDNYRFSGVNHIHDHSIYGEPSEIVIQTTHRDVFLDYFKNKKQRIFALRSGTPLRIDDKFLIANINNRDLRVARFSEKFLEFLSKLKEKGYAPIGAEVLYIVAWKGENDEEETPVILTEIHLAKKLDEKTKE